MEWIDGLNRQRFSGRSDWRVPTVDGLLTLLEAAPSADRRTRTADIFPDTVVVAWTAGLVDPGRAWAVNFGRSLGTVWDILETRVNWVRPVASLGPVS